MTTQPDPQQITDPPRREFAKALSDLADAISRFAIAFEVLAVAIQEEQTDERA